MNNVYYSVEPYTGDIICHFGLEGMKWGKRRWQYPDGRFNEAGKERYFGSKNRNNKKFITTKKETDFKISSPFNIISIAHKIVQENPNVFTEKKQQQYEHALKDIWTEENFDDKYKIDKKYTKEFDKWFSGDNALLGKSEIGQGKYTKKFAKSMLQYLTNKYPDSISFHKDADGIIRKYTYFNHRMDDKEYNAWKNGMRICLLLDIGVKPNNKNIKMYTDYARDTEYGVQSPDTVNLYNIYKNYID